jgi:TolB-like protein/DNA-binding winged helix-turn-helix (wHTH) protein/cytochrome c-type biogenesis protein CcmH/NrfG
MNNVSASRIRFGAFELEVSTGELRSLEARSSDNKIVLREQVFQVLLMLLERQGKILTREEIKKKLWPNDTVVSFDHSINTMINSLRRTLGDSADDARYIETLARRGYRWMLPIQFLNSNSEIALEAEHEEVHRDDKPSTAAPGLSLGNIRRRMNTRPWKLAAVFACVAFLSGAGYVSWRHTRPSPRTSTERIMLAVLPYKNLSGDPNQEYIADGLTEETISQLGRLDPEHLGVIARTSVMRYKNSDERLDQIGRDLSVGYVLENSLRKDGDHLRLTAQLIQMKDQTHLWSHDYNYPANDVLNIEEDMARAVAREIQVRLNPNQRVGSSRPHTVSPQAFDAYLQGHYFFERNTNKDTETAVKYYERAIQIDPNYALAWAGLSRARNWQANIQQIPVDVGHRLAREEVERALALDPNLAVAHAQMGRVERQVDFDWAGADASINRALSLAPQDPEIVGLAASSAATFGRFDEALRLAHRAVDLDPLNAGSWECLSETEFLIGHFDEAAAHSRKALDLSPDAWPGPILLSEIYLIWGRAQEALPEVKVIRYEPVRVSFNAIAYHALGRKSESDAALKQLLTKFPNNEYQIARVYAFRNQTDEAFAWLDRAYASRNEGLLETGVDPFLKSLHSDPRFAALLKKLNLPPG